MEVHTEATTFNRMVLLKFAAQTSFHTDIAHLKKNMSTGSNSVVNIKNLGNI